MKTAAFAAAGLALGLAVPAGAQGSGVWTLDTPKPPLDVAHLIYAAPGAPAPLVAVSCRRKTGQVIASFDAAQSLAASRRGETWVDRIGRPAPWPVSVTIASGAARTTLRGQASPNPAGGSTVSVEVSDRAPVLAEWKKTGALQLEALDETRAPPPAKKGLVSRFLRFCG